MLGVTRAPTRVDEMILPPLAHDVKVISIGMFVPGNQAVVWRGPMLHRALQQFLADVFWGELDVLLLDLPPGTGDIAISVAQLLPGSEMLVVTTPQQAAAEVAERAGSIAAQTRQHVAGVIENMSWLELPDGSRMEVFGTGGGQRVADSLTRSLGTDVPLLGQVPLDVNVREGGDAGVPVVLGDPDSPAAAALRGIARGPVPAPSEPGAASTLRPQPDAGLTCGRRAAPTVRLRSRRRPGRRGGRRRPSWSAAGSGGPGHRAWPAAHCRAPPSPDRRRVRCRTSW